MAHPNLTAEAAWAVSSLNPNRQPKVASTSYKCPYEACGVYAQHDWGFIVSAHNPGTMTTRSTQADGLWLSKCAACGEEVMFKRGELVWPRLRGSTPEPNVDMSADIRKDYEEARSIYLSSPRGAAALLRLAVQKLCGELGVGTDDLNRAIGKLVSDKLIAETVQQALDGLRVIGNEAVHPGSLDLRDDTETALALFAIINFVIEKTISDPRRVQEIYGMVPPAKLAGINVRDKPKRLSVLVLESEVQGLLGSPE